MFLPPIGATKNPNKCAYHFKKASTKPSCRSNCDGEKGPVVVWQRCSTLKQNKGKNSTNLWNPSYVLIFCFFVVVAFFTYTSIPEVNFQRALSVRISKYLNFAEFCVSFYRRVYKKNILIYSLRDSKSDSI